MACTSTPKGKIDILHPTARYSTASLTGKIIDTLPPATSVYLLKEKGEWKLVCFRGVQGWINLALSLQIDYVDGEPSEQSLIALAPDDSVLAEVEEGERRIYTRLSELQPWFAPDDSVYAGFYEGLPGEEIGLIIVNIFPKFMSLTVKSSYIDPEALEPREEEHFLTREIQRDKNILLLEGEDVPFSKAEFVRIGSRRALLIQREGSYALLWRRQV